MQATLFEVGPRIPAYPDYVYAVIYSVNCKRDESIGQYEPPDRRKLWTITEDDDQRELDYLCECPEEETCKCGWRHHKHRKYCAQLTQEQFDDFIADQNLEAQDVETMGSIGAPGFGFCHAPAISFDGSAYTAYQNAYVTPCPKEGEEFWPNTESWKKVRQQVIDTY